MWVAGQTDLVIVVVMVNLTSGQTREATTATRAAGRDKTVSGIVVDSEGKAVEGAEVFGGDASDMYVTPGSHRGVTDEQGRFRLEGISSHARVTAHFGKT